MCATLALISLFTSVHTKLKRYMYIHTYIRIHDFFFDTLKLEMGPIRCPKTTVTNLRLLFWDVSTPEDELTCCPETSLTSTYDLWNILIVEDETDMLSRNVGNKPNCTTQQPEQRTYQDSVSCPTPAFLTFTYERPALCSTKLQDSGEC